MRRCDNSRGWVRYPLIALRNPAAGPLLACAIALGFGVRFGWSLPVPDTILLPDTLGPTWNDDCSFAVGRDTVRWAVGDSGRVLETLNNTIQLEYTLGSGQYDLCGVSFADANHGWIVGSKREDPEGGRGVVFRTTTGGDSPREWTASFPVIRPDINVPFLQVQAVDAMRVWVTCDDGYALRSHDGGLNWLVGAKRPTVDAGGEIESERH